MSVPDGTDNLLGTIKVPKNLRLLSERLPKSNYGVKKEGISYGKSETDKALPTIEEEPKKGAAADQKKVSKAASPAESSLKREHVSERAAQAKEFEELQARYKQIKSERLMLQRANQEDHKSDSGEEINVVPRRRKIFIKEIPRSSPSKRPSPQTLEVSKKRDNSRVRLELHNSDESISSVGSNGAPRPPHSRGSSVNPPLRVLPALKALH